jgi:hypothetical protein
MTINSSTYDTFQALQKTLQSALAERNGELNLVESNDPETRTLKITSHNPNAAPVDIVLDQEFGAYVNVGKGSIFEVPFGGKRYTSEDFIGEITNLVGGIVNSGFQETVLIVKGRIVGASGIIKRGGQLQQDVSESWR